MSPLCFTLPHTHTRRLTFRQNPNAPWVHTSPKPAVRTLRTVLPVFGSTEREVYAPRSARPYHMGLRPAVVTLASSVAALCGCYYLYKHRQRRCCDTAHTHTRQVRSVTDSVGLPPPLRYAGAPTAGPAGDATTPCRAVSRPAPAAPPSSLSCTRLPSFETHRRVQGRSRIEQRALTCRSRVHLTGGVVRSQPPDNLTTAPHPHLRTLPWPSQSPRCGGRGLHGSIPGRCTFHRRAGTASWRIRTRRQRG
jgi:hypothetical protein